MNKITIKYCAIVMYMKNSHYLLKAKFLIKNNLTKNYSKTKEF